MSNITILGIRHHGVGSARNVAEMLKKIKPDMILVEGPPEMQEMIAWIGDKSLKPPVAVLCYDEENPKQASFYPFAEFSPEWVAMVYAHSNAVPVRMMDLPVANMWALEKENEPQMPPLPTDFVEPLAHFAQVAGYDDTDLWWEHQFENKHLAGQAELHFEAVMLTMETLRESGLPSSLEAENIFREAYMGNCIRQAQLEEYQQIVVVCGAWHAPALLHLEGSAEAHSKELASLPKSNIKVGASWVPWTHERLGWQSGYGAGLKSPGWYAHLWKAPKDASGTQWLSGVAKLLRDKKMDISTAHVIESVRLAEALASLRDLGRPGLMELTEATTTVMCMGDDIKMLLIEKELVVGKVMGKVPNDLPKLPLHADFETHVHKLKIARTESKKTMELDLRGELDLARSVFFYRLSLLDIEWARQTGVKSKGTFKEGWELNWKPEIVIQIIDKGIWGNSIEEATSKYLIHIGSETTAILEIATLIHKAIPAELFDVIDYLLLKINELSAITADIQELMAALGPLSHINRYGNVRGTDLRTIGNVVEVMLVRVCVGLPTACYGLDDQSAQSVFKLIRNTNEVMRLVEKPDLLDLWHKVLRTLAEKDGITPIIRGCTTRLLFDSQLLEHAETETRFGLSLSSGNEPADSAAWLEGFLGGSGTILLLDQQLWSLLYRWMAELSSDTFVQMLPILRRTFSNFPRLDRQKLGEKAKLGIVNTESGHIQPSSNQRINNLLGEQALAIFDLF